MGWNYMEAHCEGVYQAPYRAVFDAACWFMGSLQWQVLENQDGFAARGRFGAWAWFGNAIAYFRIGPEPNGTRVALTLMVERERGGSGEVDPFGYYDFLTFQWLHQIEELLIKGLKPGSGTGTLIVDSEYAKRNRILDSINEGMGPNTAPFDPNSWYDFRG